MAGAGRILGGAGEGEDLTGVEAATGTESGVKLACMKCGRQVEVKARDVREVGATVKRWDISNLDDHCDARLGCPFCQMERGGFYPLERVEAESMAEQAR